METTSLHPVEICILAGGESRRMGRDKSTLRLKDRTLLEWVEAAAAETGYRYRVVRKDLRPGMGPLGGVYTGLRAAESEVVVFLSCDMPFVSAGLIHRLPSQMAPAVEAVFTADRGRIGFPFALRAGVVEKVDGLLSAGRCSIRSLEALLESVGCSPGPGHEAELLNINEPRDLERAAETAGRFRGPAAGG